MTSTHRDIRYNKTFAEAYKQTNNMNIEAIDILTTYIEYNHKDDYNFIWNFNINNLIDKINLITRQAGLYYDNESLTGLHYYNESLSELLNCNDYKKFFGEKFGISNVDKKALQATEKALNFFNDLLQGIPNKAIFFQSLSNYYQNNDLSELHNTIHTS
jgi:hypothetical protein